MEDKLNPRYINFLDESMMEWFNKYSTGFMFVGRNPHPFGNDRHTICCGLTSIIWIAQNIEGKDCPSQRSAKQHQELGMAVGLHMPCCDRVAAAMSGLFVFQLLLYLLVIFSTVST